MFEHRVVWRCLKQAFWLNKRFNMIHWIEIGDHRTLAAVEAHLVWTELRYHGLSKTNTQIVHKVKLAKKRQEFGFLRY